jgi:hypothetical protein
LDLPQRHGIQDDVHRPAGEAFADPPHQEQVGRAGQGEVELARPPVDGLLDRREQFGRLLHLVDDDLVSAGPKRLGLRTGLPQGVEVVQGMKALVSERVGIQQQRALADLARAGQHDHRVIVAGSLQRARGPARIIGRRA